MLLWSNYSIVCFIIKKVIMGITSNKVFATAATNQLLLEGFLGVLDFGFLWFLAFLIFFVRFLIQDFCLFHLLLAFCFLVLLHLFFKCIDVLYLQTIFRLWFILGLCFNMLLVVRLAPFFLFWLFY